MVRPVIRRCKLLPSGRSYGTSIRHLLHQEDPQASSVINGWVRAFRKGKNVSFLVVNDGSTADNLQAVIPQDLIKGDNFTFGSSVTLHGSLVASRRSEQKYEFQVDEVKYLGKCGNEYPLQKMATSAEHLRGLLHLRPRTSFSAAVLRAQSDLMKALNDHFHGSEFTQVFPPIMTSSDCEGAGEVFTVRKSIDIFGRKAYLTVSTQLHLEALAMGLGKVWTIGPTFRAETSTTARHLSEFRMIEAEVVFVNELDGIMDVVENVIKALTRIAQENKDIRYIQTLDAENIEHIDLDARYSGLLRTWPRIEYVNAIEVLQKHSDQFQHKPSYESGLAVEHERFLAQYYESPVFVTRYPKEQKPFYMLPSQTGDTVECFDLLVPGMGELCGGSLRIHDHDALVSSINSHGLFKPDLQWYLDLRAYGTAPHGGFGIGWERLVGYLTSVTNVREVAAFPRWYNHCHA